jgi:hypothetical protein
MKNQLKNKSKKLCLNYFVADFKVSCFIKIENWMESSLGVLVCKMQLRRVDGYGSLIN